jgi:hypothetical protein
LHGLVAGHGAQRVHVRLGGHVAPEFFSAQAGQAVLDFDITAKAQHIGGFVTPFDAVPAGIGRPFRLHAFDIVFSIHICLPVCLCEQLGLGSRVNITPSPSIPNEVDQLPL